MPIYLFFKLSTTNHNTIKPSTKFSVHILANSILFICFLNTSHLLFSFHQSLYLFSFVLLISSLLLWKTLTDDRLSTYFLGLLMMIDYCIPLKVICLYQDIALGTQDIRLLIHKKSFA